MTSVRTPRESSRPDEWIVSNEFAQVRLSLNRDGQDVRLRIEDMRGEAVVLLDAFQLAGLTSMSAEKFSAFMDPGRIDP